jgi:hypothetical protein
MTGAVTTSPLPFSISTMAMRLPTLSRVMSLKMRAPAESSVRCTAGSWVWLSKPGCASVSRSPVSTTCFLTSSGHATAFDVEFGAERDLARLCRFEGSGSLVDHADFQRRGAAENVLGLGRVLHARQLHDDAVGALLGDHRLGDAEFVDAVVQRRHVLLDARTPGSA